MLDLTLEYGNTYVFWGLTTPYIITSDLAAVKEYYTNFQLFKKSKSGPIVLDKIGRTNLLGNHSILSDVGSPNWERKKRILDPGFKMSRLQDHISKFYQIGEQVADDLESNQLQNQFVDFGKVIAPYTIHAISSAGFSVTEEGILSDLSRGTSVIADYWVSYRKDQNPLRKTKFAALLGLDNPVRPAAETQLKHVRKLGEQLIRDRIECGQYGEVNDVLDFIIKANEENGELNMERCLDEFITMYEAGNITTSTALSFFIAEMVRNVESLETLIREVDEIWVERGISSSSSNKDIISALKDMVYLDAAVNETLRRHPPVNSGLRILQQDMKISNYKIPAGTSFVVSQQVLHHHPQYWDNPNSFDPSRFLGNEKIVPFSFVPFIAGPRKCIGKSFALLEMKIFIAIWLSRLTFEKFPESTEEILTEQSLLVRILDSRVIVRMR